MSSRKARILVVEDDGVIAEDLRASLEKMGHAVTAVLSSGEEAVEHARMERPDLILMDIRLRGGMDGIEAASRIHADYDVPVIYLSAYADDELLGRATLTEPFGYMMKPFEVRELEFTIETALYKHGVERERDNLVRALRAALERVKTQSSAIPICALRKNMRSDRDLDVLKKEHREAVLRNGVCSECLRIVREDLLRGSE